MPDLMDRIYCSEQIHVPPTFPYIMKLYCKAAIRTQPYDLLKWSAAYFRALANGEEPPVKERVEYPPYDTPFGLTPGYIKVLINQFGKDPTTTITAQTLFKKWSDICLDEFLLIKLIALLGANTTVNWVQFVGVCAGFISKTLTQTMILICDLFTEEPEGGMATVPYEFFIDLYMFLAQMECGPLTDEEKAQLDGIMYEEDICDIADKIKQGIYDGEEEILGEEFEPLGEEIVEEESESPEESFEGEEKELRKEVEDDEEKEKEVPEQGLEKEQVEENVEEVSQKSVKSDEDAGGSEKSSIKEDSQEGSIKETPEVSKTTLSDQEEEGEGFQEELKVEEIKVEEAKVEEPKQEKKLILLEDLEDSIRAQIEEKLAEEESVMDEDEKEFLELSSSLLGAAARVQKLTPEVIGFKVFKKFLRQEVPGIGPSVEAAQVELVVNFMDSWSSKQEQMVMPRNIRHWMCPPLDKVPAPEP